eukprot:scaffold1064_cov63-Phaeocystis_antarctica.AAC.1
MFGFERAQRTQPASRNHSSSAVWYMLVLGRWRCAGNAQGCAAPSARLSSASARPSSPKQARMRACLGLGLRLG